jgi:predicted metal-dependent hydrolase
MRDDSRGKTASLKAKPLTTEIETIDGKRILIHLVVNRRARAVSVRIDPTRRIAVATAPSLRYLKTAAAFASERAGWIARELARLPERETLMPGARAPLRGVMHELGYEPGRSAPRIEAGEPPRLIVPAPDPDLFEPRLMRFYKNEARADLAARVQAFASILGVRALRIQVKEIRSRWGSCSVDGALAFSWRVILAPPFVLDYLAAHETAHLKEMNHSRRFWAQVKKALPDFERGRDWLHQHGATLHAVGAC